MQEVIVKDCFSVQSILSFVFMRHSSGYPETYYVDQAVLKLTEFGVPQPLEHAGIKGLHFCAQQSAES